MFGVGGSLVVSLSCSLFGFLSSGLSLSLSILSCFLLLCFIVSSLSFSLSCLSLFCCLSSCCLLDFLEGPHVIGQVCLLTCGPLFKQHFAQGCPMTCGDGKMNVPTCQFRGVANFFRAARLQKRNCPRKTFKSIRKTVWKTRKRSAKLSETCLKNV